MKYIVFDLEFNMFFKFKEGDLVNQNLKSEIIQIGAVKLNDALETESSFQRIVKPVVYRRLNPYVRKKIKISKEEIAGGKPFRQVMEQFCAWAEDGVLCSWGHDDILGLRNNCRYFGVNTLNFDQFINVQQIYMKKNNLTDQPSLESAVEALEIQTRTPFHNALSDALYTAAIFKMIYDFSAESVINWEKIQDENERIRLNKRKLREKSGKIREE